MKLYKTSMITCFCYSMVSSVCAQQTSPKIVYPHPTAQTKTVIVESKDGFYNPQFTGFSDGVAWVQNGTTRKWGLIDTKGNIVVDFLLAFGSKEDIPSFHQGICPLVVPSKGYILADKAGRIIAQMAETRKLSAFVNGVATGFLSVKNVKKSTPLHPVYDVNAVFLNTKGQVIWANLATQIQPYDALKPMRPFKDGLAAYYDYSKHKWGYINQEGKVMIPPAMDEAKDFSEGKAAVKIDEKWGFINTKGIVVIGFIFSKEPESFTCKRAVVYKNQNGNSACYIDTLGKVCTPVFYQALPYIEGRAFVNDGHQTTLIIDTGNKILRKLENFDVCLAGGKPAVFYENGTLYRCMGVNDYRIIDFNGNTLMSGLTGTFNNDLAPFCLEVDDPEKNQGDHFIYGFTDRKGNIVIQFKRNQF